jgi:hypothetical protein
MVGVLFHDLELLNLVVMRIYFFGLLNVDQLELLDFLFKFVVGLFNIFVLFFVLANFTL